MAVEKKERHCPSGVVALWVVLSKGASGVERTVMLFTDCQKLMRTVKLRAPWRNSEADRMRPGWLFWRCFIIWDEAFPVSLLLFSNNSSRVCFLFFFQLIFPKQKKIANFHLMFVKYSRWVRKRCAFPLLKPQLPWRNQNQNIKCLARLWLESGNFTWKCSSHWC